MFEIQLWHVQLAATVGAFMQLGTTWLLGVLVGKVIAKAFPLDEYSDSHSPLYRIVLLHDLSFNQTVFVAVAVIATKTLADSAESALGFLRSVTVGRKLRAKVMDRAIGASGGSAANTDVPKKAVDLVLKIKIIEDFVAKEEHLLLFNKLRLMLCVVFTFIFTRFGGLLAVGVLGLSELISRTIERGREKCHTFVEMISNKVQKQLLDVVKNSVKIKVMKMSSEEHTILQELEETSDQALYKDALLRYIRETFQVILLALLPVVIIVLTWAQLKDGNDGEEISTSSVDSGTVLLITMFLFAEAHKSKVNLTFIFDRELAYLEAQEVVQEFIDDCRPSPATCRVDTEKNNFDKKGDEESQLGTSGITPSTSNSFKKNNIDQHSSPGLKRVYLSDTTKLSLEGITLSYQGRTQPVLRNFTKSFDRGMVHGIVGESGSGKSSTVKIVADLLTPQLGTITTWEGMSIAYVSQDQKLFDRTIRENVTYGLQKLVSDNEIWDALRAANICKWVNSLPRGLDEELADGENMVSGGQLQRLHLAHLFCACQGADVVILDECMSALDKASRDLLISNLHDFLRNKTALIVTHHSEILRICDAVHEFTPHGSSPKCRRLTSYLG